MVQPPGHPKQTKPPPTPEDNGFIIPHCIIQGRGGKDNEHLIQQHYTQHNSITAQPQQAGPTPAVTLGDPPDREPGFSVLRQMLETFPLPQDRLRDELGWQQRARRELDATTRKDLQMERLTQFDL